MDKVNLSYIVTTYNKISYLKIVIASLINNCKEDEEIIVTDGGSTDGTQEYLGALFKQGKIHQYSSEKDHGEAHGFNKGIFMSNGEIIKIITDDDIFDYDVIQKCKNYLLKNKAVDVLFANIGSLNANRSINDLLFAKSYEVWFRNWVNSETINCFICGLSFFVRKKSLANIGLFDTSFKHIDFEYSVRLTSKKSNVAFYTGLMVCAIINPNSISHADGGVVIKEIKRVSDYYKYVYPIGEKKAIKSVVQKKIWERLKAKLKPAKDPVTEYFQDYNYILEKDLDTTDYAMLYTRLSRIMRDYNENNHPQFIENIRF